MLFTGAMGKRVYLYGISILLVIVLWLFQRKETIPEELSERVKISLREVGNQLLLSNQDSTSLVLPVSELEPTRYQLSFENALFFDPARLVASIDSSFQKASLPESYRVAVIRCSDDEVAYSYEMNVGKEKTLIPCAGRLLPEGCYTISVRFLGLNKSGAGSNGLLYLLLLLGLLALVELFLYRKNRNQAIAESNGPYSALGSFRFYPEQNKLIKEAVEIPLSKKEVELLAIFVAHPNTVIKRDELTKKVWEDNGVIVGRSLDTYISKLRKKLQDDDSIKITNVHGVGYRLEV